MNFSCKNTAASDKEDQITENEDDDDLEHIRLRPLMQELRFLRTLTRQASIKYRKIS